MCQWVTQNLLWSCLLETDWSMDFCWKELSPQVSVAGWPFKEDRESTSSNLKHSSYSWFLCEVPIPSTFEMLPEKVSNSRWILKKRDFFGQKDNPFKSCCRHKVLGEDMSLTTDLTEPNVSLLQACNSPWSYITNYGSISLTGSAKESNALPLPPLLLSLDLILNMLDGKRQRASEAKSRFKFNVGCIQGLQNGDNTTCLTLRRVKFAKRSADVRRIIMITN